MVRRPRDKAKAEVAVQVVERWILAALRHRTFFSLVELNAAIAELLERLNTRRFRKLPGSRRSQFEQRETRMFSALASGLAALVAWLTSHRVVAAAMEATGVYWHTPWQALTDAGVEAQLLHAQHVKQLRGRKTDVEDSRWLARGAPVRVGAAQFRSLPAVSRPARVEPPPAEAGRPARAGPQSGAEGDRPRRRPHRGGAQRHLRQERPAHPRRSGRPAAQYRHPGLAPRTRPRQARAARRRVGPDATRRWPPGPSNSACWRRFLASTTRRPAPS